MAQHRIIEIDYHDFLDHLRAARDTKQLVEPRDGARWSEYVAETGLREAAFKAHARVKFTSANPKLVAIIGSSAWVGCYFYSTDDEAAIKYLIS